MEKDIILKAVTDPEFRKALEENTVDIDEKTRKYVLGAVHGINTHVAKAGDELLCATEPGPCGIC